MNYDNLNLFLASKNIQSVQNEKFDCQYTIFFD